MFLLAYLRDDLELLYMFSFSHSTKFHDFQQLDGKIKSQTF